MDNTIPHLSSHKVNAKAMPFNVNDNQLLSRREAAAYLGIAENTLAIWKCENRYDLAFIKLGRLVKYRKADLDAFIEKRRFAGK